MFIKKHYMLLLALSVIIASTLSVSAKERKEKKTVGSLTITVKSSIAAGDSKSDAHNSVSASTSSSGASVNSVSVTNASSSGTWGNNDKAKIKIGLKTKSGYEFDGDINDDDVDIKGIDTTDVQVKRSGDSRLYVTVTTEKLGDMEGSDTSDGYDLLVSEPYIDDTTGEVSWDGTNDCTKYDVKLFKGSDTLVKSTDTTKEVIKLGRYMTSTGTYYVRVRGVKNSNKKGKWVESAHVSLSSDEVDSIKDYNKNNSSEDSDKNNSSNSSNKSNTSNSAGPASANSTEVYHSKGVTPIDGTWADNKGTWTFTDRNGTMYRNTWAYIKNPYANTAIGQESADWFHFDENGHMQTGWFKDSNNDSFYLNPTSDGTRGRMMTGYNTIDGKKYYFEEASNGRRGALIAK